MPYFITAFFRGIRNLLFRRYENTDVRKADHVYLDVMGDPHTAATTNRLSGGMGNGF